MSAVSLPMPTPEPTSRRRGHLLDAFRNRSELSPAERALLDLIERRSESRGFCYAGQTHLADELKVTDRYVRILLKQLNAKGYVAVTHRRGHTSLLRVIKCVELSVENLAQAPPPPRNSSSGHPGTPVPPRSGTPVPGKNKYPYQGRGPKPTPHLRMHGQSDGPGQKTLPFNGERIYFDSKRPWSAADHNSPMRRTVYGFKDSRWRFVELNGVTRTVCDAHRVNDSEMLLKLIVESAGYHAPPETVRVTAAELTQWLFWI